MNEFIRDILGQSAEAVLERDGDKYVLGPNNTLGKVKRSATEQFWDNLFGRAEAIQEQGKLNRLKDLENDKVYEQLQVLRPDRKVKVTDDRKRFAGELLQAREKEEAIKQYYNLGGSNLTRDQLLTMDNGAILNLGRKEGLRNKITETIQIANAGYDTKQGAYDRDRQRQADLLQLDLNALERETRRGERDLDNRRQDLRELEFRMKENRLNRNDRQAAIAKIIEGISNMGYAITS